MKAYNHHQMLVHVIFLVLLICQIPKEVIAYPSEYQNQHHEVDLRSSSHHGHHGIGVSLIRSKRDTIDYYNEGHIQCTEDADCKGLKYSKCDRSKGLCVCPVDRPIFDNDNNICVTEAKLNSQCTFDSECDGADEFSYCGVEGKCICKDGYKIEQYPNVGYSCIRDRNTGTSKTAVTSVIIISLILVTYLG